MICMLTITNCAYVLFAIITMYILRLSIWFYIQDNPVDISYQYNLIVYNIQMNYVFLTFSQCVLIVLFYYISFFFILKVIWNNLMNLILSKSNIKIIS